MGRKLSNRQLRQRKLEAYHLIRRLYYFLRHKPENIIFAKIHGGVLGYYDHGTEEITLDYRRDLIPTLIHEFIHHMHPEWCETKVYSKERQIVSVLSSCQCKRIIMMLARCFKTSKE